MKTLEINEADEKRLLWLANVLQKMKIEINGSDEAMQLAQSIAAYAGILKQLKEYVTPQPTPAPKPVKGK